MEDLYYFHSSVIVRSPANSFPQPLAEAALRQQAAHPAFAEALYLASPSLHEELQKPTADARKQSRVQGSLLRYLARMSSRSTPFGLFAGCGVAQWGAGSHIERGRQPDRRHTRLDMHYLCALARELGEWPVVRERLRYFPNTSLYCIGEELRYTECRHDAEDAPHQISAVLAAEPVLRVLARSQGGARRAELAAVLNEAEVTAEEALAFVDELLAGQLLVSELEPSVTGAEFLPQLLRVLTRLQTEAPAAELAQVLATLQAVQRQLAALDAPGAINEPAAYERVVELLRTLPAPIEAGKLFQVDRIYGLDGGTLDAGLQPRLLAAVEALTRLVPPSEPERLTQFARQFYARYEEREVPLLEALDAESGIGYAAPAGSYAALVDDLTAAAPAATGRAIRHSDVQDFLYGKLREADRQGHYAVTLTRAELARFAPQARPLPPSLPILFYPGEGGQLVLEAVGGSSAANLLGRFAHADADIEAVVRELTALEQRHNPGVRFAEVCHLPQSRVGNILQRPHLRELEIPYLAQSTLPAGQQVPLQDLRVSVRQGQVVLRSARLNQRIVPRLSSAHNYTSQALPVYQFLCDLQTQGVQAQLNFSWQSVAFDAKFWPRLSYEGVVLQPAAWQLAAADWQPLLDGPDAELPQRLAAFRQQWHLPRRFTLADGDNELLVDADQPATVRTWLDTIRGRTTIRLREFLFEADYSPVVDSSGRAYVCQCFAALVRSTAAYGPSAATPALADAEPVTREFALGSEWLYTKLYCGPKVADRLLTTAVLPLTEALRAEGLVDKWFFIRYADPDNHLRVRLHLPDPGRIGEVIRLVNAFLAPQQAAGYLWKTQTDTYCRELERYGPRAIEQAEALFCADSQAAVQLLALSADDPEADTRHWLWGLRLIDELLTAFGYDLPRKTELLRRAKDAFAAEFGQGKELKLQVDAKYRQHRAAIEQVLGPAAAADDEAVAWLLGYHRTPPVQRAVQQVLALEAAGQLGVGLDQLLSSYVHMLLNRLISVQARLHELVIYDFLYRHYRSAQARQPATSDSRP